MQKETIKILGVKIHNSNFKDSTNKVKEWLLQDKQKQITTPNPEIILKSLKDGKFKRILNNADLNIADGIGILWAAKYLDITKNDKSKIIKFGKFILSLSAVVFNRKYIKHPLTQRVTGSDIFLKICKNSIETNTAIFLLGAAPGIAEDTKAILKKNLKGIRIVGTHSGKGTTEDDKEIRNKINQAKAEILFVAYGAPKQEKWIARNLKKIKSVKIAIGIGGSFDFVAGVKKRAPRWMQKLGIEWLYRVLQEPQRIKRIYNAIIKFPITVFRKSL